ncbi:CAP domain-containing protein [Streptomyces ipomoeae]|uniref:SCP-like protein n=2 Tax=Streptomyces ipomoeae TaxID=103232 RepID=L1KQ29_9ACTN|nr:CAP domain-containing protein [Streptomyces ipomoeae]EKX62600.1 SCP-like protein [Streptomyces ipomoeae 91-03]MDX2693952.1 CAP domain-containing protein [Streptomyces ipomoeae]MDX2823907.1 CAP domain-containing protein [Streptomyces ipomoeae]MDX2840443.1 CAP domain-containing protein [Streptomyces ipomoeae]MDX2875569.1 CAP domain-containing protein [Streptomyces ipomoeae]
MGRHRRSAAGRAATGRATGVTDTGSGPEPHYGPENLYGFAAVLEADARAAARGGGSRRRKKKVVTPVKTGLLGVSAAVAIGTVAVATGVLPGGDKYTVSGGSSSETVVPAGSPTAAASPQGGTDGAAQQQREDESTSRDSRREASPSTSPSESKTPSKKPTKKPDKASGSQKTKKPNPKPTKEKQTTTPVDVSAETQAEAAVLLLVNEERAKAGCNPVAADSGLAKLAEAFSEDMAARGFFDHTNPDGEDPWDRAAALGITGLGGENIARGQATAEAVMEAWMNSPGHRANILNCDFKTLGVGVHLGDGGPWWTQDFGY